MGSLFFVVIKFQEEYVKQGQVIAHSGNEGYSHGLHCHLTIREGAYRGKAVNPYKYIQKY